MLAEFLLVDEQKCDKTDTVDDDVLKSCSSLTIDTNVSVERQSLDFNELNSL